jgi:hypothetical protein
MENIKPEEIKEIIDVQDGLVKKLKEIYSRSQNMLVSHAYTRQCDSRSVLKTIYEEMGGR